MAKVKLPLEMANGVMVRTLDELKENFDIKKAVGYFLDGRLKSWLENRYYNEKVEQILELDEKDPELASKLCEIFDVESKEIYKINLNDVKQEQGKIEKLKQITDDDEILNQVSYVAFNQEDLNVIYEKGAKKIYLTQGTYNIDLKYSGAEYIGIQKNVIAKIDSEKEVNFVTKDIKFNNVRFDKEYDKKRNENISRKNKIVIDEKKIIYIAPNGKFEFIKLKEQMNFVYDNVQLLNEYAKSAFVEVHRLLTGIAIKGETYAVLDAEGNIFFFNDKKKGINQILIKGLYQQICLTSGIYGVALCAINEQNEVIYCELDKYDGDTDFSEYCEVKKLPPIVKITTDGTHVVLGLGVDGKVHIVNKINTNYSLPDKLPPIREFVLSDQLSYIDCDGNAGCVYKYSDGEKYFEKRCKDNETILDMAQMPMRCTAILYSDGTVDFIGEFSDAEEMLTKFNMPLRWILGEKADRIEFTIGLKSRFDGDVFGITTEGYLCTTECLCEVTDVDGINHKIKLFD